ncbi:MAG: hypothetical protein ACLQSR_02500 [Limisphaerales bacterium]
MKRITFLLALLVAGWGNAQAAPGAGDSAPASRILLIDSSSMPVGAGKATLIIGPLQRTNGVYMGNYHLKVFPYFFKNEKGRLAIVVSDKSLEEASQGKAVAITGTATADGKNGKSRPIGAIATPVDRDHGTLRLWFTAGSRKMIFEPAYHFAGKGKALVLAEAAESKR